MHVTLWRIRDRNKTKQAEISLELESHETGHQEKRSCFRRGSFLSKSTKTRTTKKHESKYHTTVTESSRQEDDAAKKRCHSSLFLALD